ncbi:MAG: amino acid permease [Parachlamydiales bacterium]
MPTATAMAGFVPAVLAFLLAWAFMTTTALLLLEVNLWMGPNVSIVSMAGRTLGVVGKGLSWFLFCYLFYLILTAYTAGSGQLVAEFVTYYGGQPPPVWAGSLIVTAILGLLVFIGTAACDYVNRYLMVGLVVSYVALVAFGFPEIRGELLRHLYWEKAPFAMPVLVIAFGFHNMLPTLTHYLEGDARHMRQVVIIGSLIPLAIYLVWEAVVLGIVPPEIFFLGGNDEGEIAPKALAAVLGKGWITLAGELFAFFAIVTSVLGQALSLVDFLADGFKTPRTQLWRGMLTLLALVPPYMAALYNPGIFVKALQMAGAYGAVVLFGIMPSLMVWQLRYREGKETFHAARGGRPMLVVVILVALGVMGIQLAKQLGMAG